MLIRADGNLTVRAPRGMKASEIDRIVREHANWIDDAKARQAKKQDRFAHLTEEDILALKRMAKSILPPMVAKFSRIMGLSYGRITITSAKTRFGSCSAEGNISFSWRLMCYPTQAQEYVVVHELAHRRFMNHSKNFYRLIEDVLPDYKQRQKLLKE